MIIGFCLRVLERIVNLEYYDRYAATSPEIEEKDWNGHYFSDPVRNEGNYASDPPQVR